MILKNGATVARGAVMQPRIEAEIAFVMKQDLAGSNITPEAVIAATDYVVPAIETCGSRIADGNIHIEGRALPKILVVYVTHSCYDDRSPP
jgi:2-keto-4-pentenoate hydratase